MMAGTRRTVLVSQGAVLGKCNAAATVSRRRPAAGPSRVDEVEAVRRNRNAHLEGCTVEGKVCEDFLDAIGEWWFRIPQQPAERGLGGSGH